MTVDAIEGARYRDPVYDDECTITNVESESNHADPHGIDVTLEYDRLGEMTVTLKTFQKSNLEVLNVPDET